MPLTNVCALDPLYITVPPQVFPAGMGKALVAVGTDVLIVPVLLMEVNIPLNTVVVPKSSIEVVALVVKVPFTTNPVSVVEVTVEAAATVRLLNVLVAVVPLITVVPLKFTVPLLGVKVPLLE